MDLGAMLNEDDMPIAEYLVGSLDADGYLRCSTTKSAPNSTSSRSRSRP